MSENNNGLLPNVSEPLRSIVIAAFFLITGILSVLSIHFGDLAKSPFGWTLWDISAVVSPILFIGGIVKIAQANKRADKTDA